MDTWRAVAGTGVHLEQFSLRRIAQTSAFPASGVEMSRPARFNSLTSLLSHLALSRLASQIRMAHEILLQLATSLAPFMSTVPPLS